MKSKGNPRGRTPRLSREAVVSSALSLLEREGRSAVTMTRVASAVDASPMSLYRHVSDRDELLASMLEALLDRLEIEISPSLRWQEAVTSWMSHVRGHFLAHPRIITLIDFEAGAFISPSWVRIAGELITPLRKAGFHDVGLVRALLWVTRATIGTVIQELSAPIADTAAVVGGVAGLEADKAMLWLDLLPGFAALDDDAFFETATQETLQTLEAWLGNEEFVA